MHSVVLPPLRQKRGMPVTNFKSKHFWWIAQDYKILLQTEESFEILVLQMPPFMIDKVFLCFVHISIVKGNLGHNKILRVWVKSNLQIGKYQTERGLLFQRQNTRGKYHWENSEAKFKNLIGLQLHHFLFEDTLLKSP